MNHLQKLKCEQNHSKLNEEVKLAALMVQLRREQETSALLHIDHARHQQEINEHHAAIEGLEKMIVDLKTQHASEALANSLHATQLQLLLKEKQTKLEKQTSELEDVKARLKGVRLQLQEQNATVATLKQELDRKQQKKQVVVSEPKLKQSIQTVEKESGDLQILQQKSQQLEESQGKTTN